jgi:hypothetical protein
MKNKKINVFLRVAFGAVVIVGVLAVNGCIFGTPPPEDPGVTPGLDSPAGVAALIQEAYMTRDLDLYKACLSPNFTFYFDPNNIGEDVDGYIIPDSWGYDDEVDAIANMFDNAYDIDLTIVTANIGKPDPSDEGFSAPNVAIDLLVMVDPTNGFQAEGPVDFDFESYPNPEDPSKKLWRVRKWWDRTWKPS